MWLAIFLGVQVLFTLPETCGTALQYQIAGCYRTGANFVWIRADMKPIATDYVIFHELAHYQGIMDEKKADEFAKLYSGGYELTYQDVFPD